MEKGEVLELTLIVFRKLNFGKNALLKTSINKLDYKLNLFLASFTLNEL